MPRSPRSSPTWTARGRKQEFDKLLAALDTGVDDLHSMATAAKTGDSAQAQTAAQELVKSGQRITAAENALKTAVDG